MKASVSDSFHLEGLFCVYKFDISNPRNEIMIYENHNQVQTYGCATLGSVIVQGMTADNHISFSNMKASSAFYSSTGSTGNETLSVDSIILPGESISGQPLLREADIFSSGVITNLLQDQYVENIGVFTTPPPSSSPLVQYGTYYHFGLYLSSFKDIEEVLFAYKFIEKGITFDNEAGLRIVWNIKMASS